MADVTLRRATQADAAALGVLHVASWHETYPGMVPDEMLAGLSVDARTAMWSRVLDTPDAFGGLAVFIAENDGRAIGFGSCGQQREQPLTDKGFTGEFGALYVLRSHQGRGVGRTMMLAMANNLSEAGHTAACLWVLRQNMPARHFYEKLGGTIVDERTDESFGAPLVEVAYGWCSLSSLCS